MKVGAVLFKSHILLCKKKKKKVLSKYKQLINNITRIALLKFCIVKKKVYFHWEKPFKLLINPNNWKILLKVDIWITYAYHNSGIHSAAKSLQSCQTLCDPIDGSPPGSSIPWILQARTLEWVAISFSNAWKWKVKVKLLSCVQLLATSWTAAYQAPLSMGFSRQEYWSGMPLPSPGIHSRSV